MKWKCKKPNIIKNKFISTCIGVLSIYIGLIPLFMLASLSVYITSYIHYHQDFVTMHYGYFFNLILDISYALGTAIGGILGEKIGFNYTTLLGTLICLIANIFFFRVQNIWLCYVLIFIIGIGYGIGTSLLLRNATFFKPNKKALILSVLSLIVSLLSGVFSLAGEKIITLEGETLEEDQEFYSEDIANRTYLAFIIPFFSIPIGDILFLLFNYEYIEEKKSNKKGIKNDKDKDNNINKDEDNNNNKEEDNNNDKNDENNNDNSLDNKDDIIINESGNEQKENNDDDKLNKEQSEEEDSPLNDNILEETQKTDKFMKKKIKIVLKTWRFWRIALTNFLISFPLTLMTNTGRTFGALIGIDGGVLQYLISSQLLILIIFGPIFGFISDKKGPLFILRLSMIISIIGTIILFFFTDNTVAFMLSFIISSVGTTGPNVTYIPLLMDIYGIRESVILGSINYTVGILAEVITTILAFVIPFFYSDRELIKPYKIFFLIGTISNAIGFVVFLFEKKEKFDYGIDTSTLDNLVDGKIITDTGTNKDL